MRLKPELQVIELLDFWTFAPLAGIVDDPHGSVGGFWKVVCLNQSRYGCFSMLPSVAQITVNAGCVPRKWTARTPVRSRLATFLLCCLTIWTNWRTWALVLVAARVVVSH